MAWLVGIDEAGYGPNLGPFVMTAVAARVADDAVALDLWDVLRDVTRRHGEADDGRLLVADSKVVYASGDGLNSLAQVVHALLGPCPAENCTSLDHLLTAFCPEALAFLNEEAWYAGTVEVTTSERIDHKCRAAGVEALAVRGAVVCTPRFNDLAATAGSKGAVLGHALCQLAAWRPDGDDGISPLHYHIDKHGGRNRYAALVQQAVAGGMVVSGEEGRDRSSYRVLGLPREMHFTFQPRADGAYFCVALASMVSKYLRELLMAEFNRFWQGHVPGLKATAGYPLDAMRFYEAIRPAAQRLGMSDRALWRQR